MKASTKKTLAWTAGALIGLSVVGALTAPSEQTSSGRPSGLVLSQDNFNKSCVPAATNGSNGLTEVQANSYCGCVYQQGLDYYGGEQWTKELETLGSSNNLSPKMNDFVNYCIGKI